MTDDGYAGDLAPREAWNMLAADDRAVLVDCRTQAEWAFVGIPDLGGLGRQALLVPWQTFPDMSANPAFVEQVAAQMAAQGEEREAPVLFLCRSGQRSRAAAITMTARGYERCYNVSDGFEGPPDGAQHRGTVAGWKAEELPWKQG